MTTTPTQHEAETLADLIQNGIVFDSGRIKAAAHLRRIPTLEAENEALKARVAELEARHARILKAAEEAHGPGAFRFKMSLNKRGTASNMFPQWLDQRWVSFVYAEDDAHIGLHARLAELEAQAATLDQSTRDGLEREARLMARCVELDAKASELEAQIPKGLNFVGQSVDDQVIDYDGGPVTLLNSHFEGCTFNFIGIAAQTLQFLIMLDERMPGSALKMLNAARESLGLPVEAQRVPLTDADALLKRCADGFSSFIMGRRLSRRARDLLRSDIDDWISRYGITPKGQG